MWRLSLWQDLVLLAAAGATTSTEPAACVQLAMFKDSSSGSSWFLQQLNAHPGVSLKNELLVARTAATGPTKQRTLVGSLSTLDWLN